MPSAKLEAIPELSGPQQEVTVCPAGALRQNRLNRR